MNRWSAIRFAVWSSRRERKLTCHVTTANAAKLYVESQGARRLQSMHSPPIGGVAVPLTPVLRPATCFTPK